MVLGRSSEWGSSPVHWQAPAVHRTCPDSVCNAVAPQENLRALRPISTSPPCVHRYLSSALPRSLLAALPLSVAGAVMERRIRPQASPVANLITQTIVMRLRRHSSRSTQVAAASLYVALYSLLAHKAKTSQFSHSDPSSQRPSPVLPLKNWVDHRAAGGALPPSSAHALQLWGGMLPVTCTPEPHKKRCLGGGLRLLLRRIGSHTGRKGCHDLGRVLELPGRDPPQPCIPVQTSQRCLSLPGAYFCPCHLRGAGLCSNSTSCMPRACVLRTASPELLGACVCISTCCPR